MLIYLLIVNEYRYIEKLIYTENTIKKELNFKKGINVIIGPKGGGKSCLLKLLWMLKNYKNINGIKNTFNKFNIKIHGIKISDTINIIKISEQKFSWNNKDSDIENFLKQNDKVKTELHTIENIKKEREVFLKDLISNNVQSLFDEFNKTIENFKKLPSFFDNFNKINWIEIFNSLSKFEDDKLILLIKKWLLKKPFKIEIKLIKYLEETENLIEENIIKLKRLDQEIKNYAILKNIENIYNDIENFKKTLIKIRNYKEKIENYNKIYKFYEKSTKSLETKLKESKNTNERLTSEKEETKIFFLKISKILFSIKKDFKNLKKEKKIIELNDRKKSKNIEKFYLVINKKIKIGQYNLIDDILKKFLNSPTKKEKWIPWVKENLIKKQKLDSLNKEMLIKKIIEEFNENDDEKKELLDYVELENKEKQKYSEMSLGQRSILGIKNKLENIDGYTILFLDQLEDNLDNYTIQNEIVNILNENSKVKQIFVVTHNANIGINSNVDNVIVCKLNKNNTKDQYKNININTETTRSDIKNSDLTHFLEGGENALKLRYKKVFNIKKEL